MEIPDGPALTQKPRRSTSAEGYSEFIRTSFQFHSFSLIFLFIYIIIFFFPRSLDWRFGIGGHHKSIGAGRRDILATAQ